MGFLSGVLKDVSEKQPYSVGKPNLCILIENLEKHLCCGHKGFKKAIDLITQCVTVYNKAVRESNDNITSVVETMHNSVKHINNQVSELNENNALQDRDVSKAVDKATQLVGLSLDYGTTFENGIKKTQSNICDLNSMLHTKIVNVAQTVANDRDWLSRSSSNATKDLISMIDGITWVLGDLKKNINEQIKTQVNGLVDTLKGKVSDIKTRLLYIESKLRDHIDELRRWMEEAKKFIDGSITKQVNYIIQRDVGIEHQDRLYGITKNIEDSYDQAESHVKQLTTETLQAVRDMDGKLKKDLKHMKNNIKTAIMTLGTKLEKNVRDGLWKIEDAITNDVDEISRNSVQFSEAFRNIKYALQTTIDQVFQDISKLVNISNFDNIMNGQHSMIAAPILRAIGKNGRNLFDPLTEYFSKLDDVVMQLVKEAMRKIGDGIRVGGIGNISGLQSSLKTSKLGETLKGIQSIADAVEPSNLPDASKLQIEGVGTIKGIVKLDIHAYTVNLTHLITKVNGNSLSPSEKLTHNDIESLLSDLGNIAKTISDHSKHVVEKVMDKIKNQVALEVKKIFTALCEKTAKIKYGIESSHADVDLNGSSNLLGVQKLVSDFGTSIDQRISHLKNHVIPKAFKMTDSTPRKAEKYVFGEQLMNDFKHTYDTNLKNGTLKTEDGQNDVLERHIGKDGLSPTGRNDKISHLGEDAFVEYKLQVDQESLSTSDLDISKLTGILPETIKQLGSKGFDTFEKKLKGDDLDSGNTIGFLDQIRHNLNALIQAFIDIGQHLKGHLNMFKTQTIDEQLNSIKDHLYSLHNNLADVITLATKFIETDADKFGNQTIDALIYFVDRQIEKSTSTLTTAARRNYVTSVKSLLTAFADKVTEELAPLPGEIDEDLRIGFKGLMRKVQGELQPNKTLNDENIKLLSTIATIAEQKFDQNESFIKLSYAFRNYYFKLNTYARGEITRVHNDNNSKKNPPGKDTEPYSDKMSKIKGAVDKLLGHIADKHRYDYNVPEMLDELQKAITDLKPDNFDKPNTPVMDAMTDGLQEFVKELRKVYVSAYDSQQFASDVIEDTGTDVVYTTGVHRITKLSDYGRKCAKVFFTSLEILKYDLNYLREGCRTSWSSKKVCLKMSNDDANDLGEFFEYCGYGVPSREGKQDSELKCKNDWTGKQIREKLLVFDHSAVSGGNKFKLVSDDDERDAVIKNGEETDGDAERVGATNPPNHGVVRKLIDQLTRYYQVCHYATLSSKRYPSSVYEMLMWLASLPHNPVHHDLTFTGFSALFEKDEKKTDDSEHGGITVDFNEDSLEAYKETITVSSLSDALTGVCGHAHSVLTAILGHGHAGSMYACDFNTNPYGFLYPSDMNALICMLFDVVKRVHHQLYFLLRQCMHDSTLSGWSDCWYGRSVGGSDWKCNALQCPDQSGDQIHNQTCNQKCDQTANCGLKSPLQSFLEDGLHGFLPHQLKVERGALVCTVKHSGMPCKTPMGFADISNMASHREKGRHIYLILMDVCGDQRSPLSRLSSLLNCLVPSAPNTLDDLFGFYINLVNGWNSKAKDAFNNTINEANFNRNNAPLDITTIFKTFSHGSGQDIAHLKGDLYALVNCNGNSFSPPSHPCGPYLRPLCYNRSYTFATEHNDKYLSWIVYLTETFHQLLEKLYEECCKNCDSSGSKCRISKCAKGCAAKEKPLSPTSTHNKSCKTIVDCKYMRPTLFKYGFVHRNATTLAEWTSTSKSRRTCKDFCDLLKIVIKQNNALHKLAHDTIPKYLLAIRAPFLWMNVALWLLSLLYLIHIMVIRLDLLHIKSHLHSPSSHRIAAQSLLAAGRVNKLGKVFYLQP